MRILAVRPPAVKCKCSLLNELEQNNREYVSHIKLDVLDHMSQGKASTPGIFQH